MFKHIRLAAAIIAVTLIGTAFVPCANASLPVQHSKTAVRGFATLYPQKSSITGSHTSPIRTITVKRVRNGRILATNVKRLRVGLGLYSVTTTEKFQFYRAETYPVAAHSPDYCIVDSGYISYDGTTVEYYGSAGWILSGPVTSQYSGICYNGYTSSYDSFTGAWSATWSEDEYVLVDGQEYQYVPSPTPELSPGESDSLALDATGIAHIATGRTIYGRVTTRKLYEYVNVHR